MSRPINTDRFSDQMRRRGIDVSGQRVLVTDFRGTGQESDLTEPPNCGGLGRIRHFRRQTSPGWPNNPLPIDPACAWLGCSTADLLEAQVFQNAVCNWRCWYCYVPFELLSGNERLAKWVTATELLDAWQTEPRRPRVIDLSGGQPDLTPEWVIWMMQEIRKRGLEKAVYLWSDDNLSNDYFWQFLTDSERASVAAYRGYGKVCCFKGFDETSFAFNTGASGDLFVRQFELFRTYLALGLDLYGYATFTSRPPTDMQGAMRRFADRLQAIAENLPLRVVPLEIRVFSPVHGRMNIAHETALRTQQEAVALWKTEIETRFSLSLRQMAINEIPVA